MLLYVERFFRVILFILITTQRLCWGCFHRIGAYGRAICCLEIAGLWITTWDSLFYGSVITPLSDLTHNFFCQRSLLFNLSQCVGVAHVGDVLIVEELQGWILWEESRSCPPVRQSHGQGGSPTKCPPSGHVSTPWKCGVPGVPPQPWLHELLQPDASSYFVNCFSQCISWYSLSKNI